MIVATIAFAALLGSASVAQAGRKCVACGASKDDYSSLARSDSRVLHVLKEVMRKHKVCAPDLSKYLALPVREQMLHGISIKDCGDDPCFFLRAEPKVPGPMNPVGGTRGCFTAELRAGAEKVTGLKVPLTKSPAACKNIKHQGLDAEVLETEVCLEVCDTDRCNVKRHRTRATRATSAINDASADASIVKKKARNST